MNSIANELSPGKPSPGNQPAGIGHNIRSIDLIQERVEALARAANNWAKQVQEIADEETARRADDYLSQLTAELKRVEEERKAEKQPHIEAGKAIDLAYGPLKLVLEVAKSLIAPKVTSWLRRKRQAEEAEKRRQQEEAERLQREAEAAAAKAAAGQGDIVQNKVQATLLAATAAAAAEEAAKPVARSQVRGDLSYRARSLKVLWRAEIEDVFLTLIYFQDRPEVRDLLTRLACAEAPAAHRDGKEIPGCRLYPIEAAA